MNSRVTGGSMLVAALLAVLIVPRLVSPPVIDGVATIAPPGPPPAVGDCIERSAASSAVGPDGELAADPPVAIVGCDQLHESEVVRIEDDVPGSDDAVKGPAAIHDFLLRCVAENLPAWGAATAPGYGWKPDLIVTSGTFGPDVRQRAAGQHWAACAVGVTAGELNQSLADLSSVDVPPALGSCTVTVEGPAPTVAVNCAAPHTGETFGRRDLAPGSDLGTDELVAGCVDLVVDATGRPGVVDDPTLRIDAEAFAVGADLNPGPVALPLADDGTGGWATCSVRTQDRRELTASLRGIGDAPLPWAP